MIKTGECYFLNDEGVLCLAESFMDDEGNVETKVSVVE
jgi:hypothetical protein